MTPPRGPGHPQPVRGRVIPEEKKVNLISIQLEAFADLLPVRHRRPPTSTGVPRPSRRRATPAPSSPTSSPGAPRRPRAVLTGGNRPGTSPTTPTPWPGTSKSRGTANGSPPLPGLVLQPPDGEPQPGPGRLPLHRQLLLPVHPGGGGRGLRRRVLPRSGGAAHEYFATNEAPSFLQRHLPGPRPYDTDRVWGSGGLLPGTTSRPPSTP